jgi:hypothetical protein
MDYVSLKRVVIIKITEYKGGCIYKTKNLGMLWVREDIFYDKDLTEEFKLKKDIATKFGGDQLGSLSTDFSRNNYSECFRSVSENEVSMYCEALSPMPY